MNYWVSTSSGSSNLKVYDGLMRSESDSWTKRNSACHKQNKVKAGRKRAKDRVGEERRVTTRALRLAQTAGLDGDGD